MLRPYQPHDFPLLASWINDPFLLFQYSGTYFKYPITRDQMDRYQAQYPKREFYFGLLDDGTPYALGEIIPQDAHSVRLGRLLVGDASMRGKGLGLRFIQELMEEAIRKFHPQRVDLYVIANNHAAVRCYMKAGFEWAEEESLFLRYQNQEYQVRKMSHMLQQ